MTDTLRHNDILGGDLLLHEQQAWNLGVLGDQAALDATTRSMRERIVTVGAGYEFDSKDRERAAHAVTSLVGSYNRGFGVHPDRSPDDVLQRAVEVRTMHFFDAEVSVAKGVARVFWTAAQKQGGLGVAPVINRAVQEGMYGQGSALGLDAYIQLQDRKTPRFLDGDKAVFGGKLIQRIIAVHELEDLEDVRHVPPDDDAVLRHDYTNESGGNGLLRTFIDNTTGQGE